MPAAFARTLPAQLGRYTLRSQLGTGGMAEVFLATYAAPGGFEKQVVVKVLLPHLAQSARYITMFQREASIAARLHHPNLVQVLEFAQEGSVPYIVMEYIDGIPLNRLARRAWTHKRSVPLELCMTAIADAALGLGYAHREGLVHRDVSPDNLMITKQGITKVLDFGIAKGADSESVTKTGEVKGKIPFMAPELIRGEAATSLADIYALGVSFYWLVTGLRPFRGNEIATLHAALTQDAPRPSSINPSLPPPIDALIMAMLEKEPARRIKTAEDVHAALDFASIARQRIVVPFVEQALALPDDGALEGPTTDGFLPSQPTLDIARAMELTALEVPTQEAAARAAAEGATLSPALSPPRGVLAPVETAITARHDASVVDAAPSETMTAAARAAQRARPRLAAAAVVVLGCALVGVIALRGAADDAPPVPAPAPVTAPPPPVGADPLAQPASTSPPPPAPAPAAPTPVAEGAPSPDASASPPAKAAADVPRPTARAQTQRVTLRAPAHVQWLDGKSVVASGNGAVQVDARTRTLVALDTKRGGRTDIRIQGGVADYAAAPKGKLQIRAFPFAEVLVGKERIGTTPFPDVALTAGTYTVTLRYEKKTETRKVRIQPQQTERITVRFE